MAFCGSRGWRRRRLQGLYQQADGFCAAFGLLLADLDESHAAVKQEGVGIGRVEIDFAGEHRRQRTRDSLRVLVKRAANAATDSGRTREEVIAAAGREGGTELCTLP